MYQNINEHLAAAVQAELRKTIVQMKQQRAITKGTFKSGYGARGKAGKLAGLEIPFKINVPHGSTALDPIDGGTSFERFIPARTNKMYVGLAQTGFTVEWEWFHQTDAARGNLPEGKEEARDQGLMTYMQEHNWYCIGKGDGMLAKVLSGGGTANLVFYADNSERGSSKGSLRLAVSYSDAAAGSADGRVIYDAINPSTGVLTGSFYLTAKPSATQGTAVLVTGTGALPANNDIIVKHGHYMKVPYGLGYHINQTARDYQGADTSVYDFLNSRRVDGGNGPITPTIIDAAKGALQVRANDANARKNRVCHLTIGHYKTLSAFGYTLRIYNAEKGDADTTYGLPFVYEDEDTVFIQDADMEDGYIYMRDRSSYFEYRQKELSEVTSSPEQWVGTEQRGSTEFFQNWGEAYNLAWDARGDDGKGTTPNGAPNSSVVIDNLEIPDLNQVAEGISLV